MARGRRGERGTRKENKTILETNAESEQMETEDALAEEPASRQTTKTLTGKITKMLTGILQRTGEGCAASGKESEKSDGRPGLKRKAKAESKVKSSKRAKSSQQQRECRIEPMAF
jgi:hypothetical protein